MEYNILTTHHLHHTSSSPPTLQQHEEEQKEQEQERQAQAAAAARQAQEEAVADLRPGTNARVPETYCVPVALVASIAQHVAAQADCVALVNAVTDGSTGRDGMPGPLALEKFAQEIPLWEKQQLHLMSSVYYVGKLTAKAAGGGILEQQDARGNYLVQQGDHLAWRYEVAGLLGQGAFAAVYQCLDHAKKGLCSLWQCVQCVWYVNDGRG